MRWPPETFVTWKLEGLAARGMSVTVASRSVFDPEVSLRGVELLKLPARPSSAWAARRTVVRDCLRLLLSSPRRLARLVRGVMKVPAEFRTRHGGFSGVLAMCLPLARLSPDVVHFEWHMVAVDYLPLFDVWDCPILTSCRGSDISVYPHVPDLGHYAARLPIVLSRASAVHCVSTSLAREAGRFGLDSSKTRVIRPAVDPEVFRPAQANSRVAARDDGVLRLISVGWLRWEKGHEYAQLALRALLDRGVEARLEILGSVPEEWRGRSGERERILHTAADLGLGAHVLLAGHAPSAEVSRRLQASDVLVHAAVTEGIPNAIVEAMACELPVVATHAGGIPEVIRDGVEGLLVPPRDPERMAGALLALSRDPAKRARMGMAGRARVLPELTLEYEHRAFFEMYREATGT